MPRVYLPGLTVGTQALPPEEATHLRRVLRLGAGDAVRLFDGEGGEAEGELTADGVRVEAVSRRAALPELTVLAATPKGDRADVMVEKLAELGVTAWVPLTCERSVVLPKAGKLARWRRRAVEAAKQADTPRVMRIDEPLPLADAAAGGGVVLSLADGARPMPGDVGRLLVGPEGGWTGEEEAMLREAGCGFATLGVTVLRVETAAVVGAGVVRAGQV